ncbi:sensor histidine kinase [Phaeacidiphilus oryzae]|uniref:sensor histidine kinase n=1 Tax=Phaeacidiphilus oryzae TaxID=348818 RepID=UPI0007C6CEF9|nr:sensor histidine kinase [Phaeacidiphilus oryzae]
MRVPPLTGRRPVLRRPRSLAGRLFVLQVLIVTLLVALGAGLAYAFTEHRAEDSALDRAQSVAESVADSPDVLSAAAAAHPSARLQPYTERLRGDARVEWITVMSPQGIRWTHPDPAQIGRHFRGHTAAALAGGVVRETYTGTLGPSVRVVVPVRGAHGQVVALVGAGIAVDSISRQLRSPLALLVLAALTVLALGGLATYLVTARLRRQTHGMDSRQLSHLYDYHRATLHSVREGLLLLDREQRVVLCNDAARGLLELGREEEPTGRPLAGLRLPPELLRALAEGRQVRDEVHLTEDRVLLVNTSAIEGGFGTAVTLRDHTELQALTGELDSARGFAEALAAQTHEAANRLHAVVSLIELGRPAEAVDFATAELEATQLLADRVVDAVREPVLAALLLGKTAQAAERGVDLVLSADSRVDDGLPADSHPRDLVTILGNLVDNAIDAAILGAGRHPGIPTVTVTLRVDGAELLVRVADSGPGIPGDLAEEVFRRGWTTKDPGEGGAHGLGLALVAQAVRRGGGRVEVGTGETPATPGAVVTVRLPLPLPQSRPQTQTQTSAEPLPLPGYEAVVRG